MSVGWCNDVPCGRCWGSDDLVTVLLCRAFLSDFDWVKQYKPWTTEPVMFASLRLNVTSVLCSKEFWLGWNDFGWRGMCEDGRTIAPEIITLKTFFQEKQRCSLILSPWIWPKLLSKHLSICWAFSNYLYQLHSTTIFPNFLGNPGQGFLNTKLKIVKSLLKNVLSTTSLASQGTVRGPQVAPCYAAGCS